MASDWDEVRFISELVRTSGADGVKVFLQIRDWATARSLSPWYGKGGSYGTWYPGLPSVGKKYRLFGVWTSGQIELWLGEMRDIPPFDDRDKRLEIIRWLNLIPGIDISKDKVDGYPRLPLKSLAQPAALEQFLAVYNWVIKEIRLPNTAR